jgi:ABC-type dipeptide/oligopeptide/nickel transport system permease component
MVVEWLFNWQGMGLALILAIQRGEPHTVSWLLLLLAMMLFLLEKATRMAIAKVDPTTSGPEVPR